ncbi:hypothetical protein FGO68_gene5044 [Halteria grandinella]|uniref:Uncharacterized protein n=1 Tax=Halteria grandinella TaxID=5974 RepID=A0A8J8NFN7_HALGN|nr:hypothetical protein FGO68_gene5044 [Halteria grandinella]
MQSLNESVRVHEQKSSCLQFWNSALYWPTLLLSLPNSCLFPNAVTPKPQARKAGTMVQKRAPREEEQTCLNWQPATPKKRVTQRVFQPPAAFQRRLLKGLVLCLWAATRLVWISSQSWKTIFSGVYL